MVAGNYHAFTGTQLRDEWTAQLGKLHAMAESQGYTHIRRPRNPKVAWRC